MNDTNQNASQPSGEGQPAGTPPTSATTGGCVFDPLRSAFQAGAQRAKDAAEKAVPKVKAAVSGATYWLGFGISFASVFTYTLARELAPEPLKAGCRDGAQAGRRTAEDLAAKREQSEAPGAAPSPGMAS